MKLPPATSVSSPGSAWAWLIGTLAGLALCGGCAGGGPRAGVAAEADWKIGWWDIQRKGASQENSRFRPEWFEAAGKLGLDFVRLATARWPADGRDFLLGDADDFRRVNEKDLAVVVRALDKAEAHGVKVVLVALSLPGARWKQLNGGRDDGRLWRDEKYWGQAMAYWRQLAGRLKDHPAVVAYNLLNEPHPEREYGFEDRDEKFAAWFQQTQGTAADLNRFHRELVRTIREVDPHTPIMLDGWFYAAPQAYRYMQPVDDARVLYAFHNPGPWQMTAYRINKGRYAYPDRVPTSWDGPPEAWDRARLAKEMDPVRGFARTYNVPSNRIIASEFWYDRRVPGAREYLADVIRTCNDSGWHWAFYAYRGDGEWTGLDYELGTRPNPGRGFWPAVERGEDPERFKDRRDNPLWEVIQRQFRGAWGQVLISD